MLLRVQRVLHLRSRSHIALCLIGVLAIWSLVQHRLVFAPVQYCKSLWVKKDPSVNLVLATMSYQTYEWTSKITVPNAQLVPYVVDKPDAPFHTPENKGHEAMVYLTYLYEFYDDLPDITIFTHGQDGAWHMDGILEWSTAYAINNLDLDEVFRRQYVNLRISWENGCPDWINTTISAHSAEYDPGLKGEEIMMKSSFQQIFPNTTAPELLAQPCCAQFAVTKEAIRSVPRERYQESVKWLQKTNMEDNYSGRVWEHLWQYMFLQKAVDCPIEYKALCRTYHICFEKEEDWDAWKYLDQTRHELEQDLADLRIMRNRALTQRVKNLETKIDSISRKVDPCKEKAIELGKSRRARNRIAGDL